MSDMRFDVVGLGNAIVDVIAWADDDLLVREKLHKGSMTLVDEQRADQLYNAMGPATIISGGSAANTIVGVASFGARTAFIGKVRDDEAGKAFSHDIRSIGVHFGVSAAQDGPATARCLVMVTPDGERTMSTYLGACQNLTPNDVDADIIRASGITYLEGYLWDPPAAKEAFVKAAEIAHGAGRNVALTLSDSFCVDRYRDEFLDLIQNGTLDVVFANQHELKALYQTSDLQTAIAALRSENILGVVTCSADGSIVVTREETHAVPAFPIENLVDTTGAGDLFAAGFLAGLARGADFVTCARFGSIAAAEVIQHIGARPQTRLSDLASEAGLDA